MKKSGYQSSQGPLIALITLITPNFLKKNLHISKNRRNFAPVKGQKW